MKKVLPFIGMVLLVVFGFMLAMAMGVIPSTIGMASAQTVIVPDGTTMQEIQALQASGATMAERFIYAAGFFIGMSVFMFLLYHSVPTGTVREFINGMKEFAASDGKRNWFDTFVESVDTGWAFAEGFINEAEKETLDKLQQRYRQKRATVTGISIDAESGHTSMNMAPQTEGGFDAPKL